MKRKNLAGTADQRQQQVELLRPLFRLHQHPARTTGRMPAEEEDPTRKEKARTTKEARKAASDKKAINVPYVDRDFTTQMYPLKDGQNEGGDN